MKPNYALSLSYEGIGLLRRVVGGWHLIGEVALDADDLAGDLSALRDQASAMDGQGFACKIILPNDQIKYLAVDTGRTGRKERLKLAGQALVDNTPYALDELAFDISAARRITHVAAVARDTLAEAEAFAVEHGFTPVSFAAIPPETEFPTEPFFGPTVLAAGQTDIDISSADALPIEIVSRGPLSEAQIETPLAAADTPEQEPSKDVPPAPSETAPQDPAPQEHAAEPEIPPVEPAASFSSIRAHRSAPEATPSGELQGATRDDPSATRAQRVRFDPTAALADLKPAAKVESDLPDPQEKPDVAAAPQNDLQADQAGFSSQRSAPVPDAPAPIAEKRTQTHTQTAKPKRDKTSKAAKKAQGAAAFADRESPQIGGKPRHLGLILMLVLLAFLAVVALWASLFTDDGIAGLFGTEDIPQIAELEQETAPVETNVLPPEQPMSLTDSAEVEALTDINHPTAPTTKEAEARYAVTGIWEQAPVQTATPPAGSTDDLYMTSIDRVVIAQDAVALPSMPALQTDTSLLKQLDPVSADTSFELDENGLVVATASGSLNPDGVMVYLGRPSVLPAKFPDRATAVQSSQTTDQIARLATLRPQLRPSGLVETNERATNGGRSIAELGNIRPKARPALAKDAEEKDTTPTALAINSSVKPRLRPSNIAQIAARSKSAEPVKATPVAATVTPKIPSTASVARQATIQNAINLNKVNLIGVYGTSSSRRALVRLSNGRYKKVQVGDRIDGGKVAAISDSELRYVKSGRNVVLKLPKG
ncbi:hypothetical protein FAP39_11760 [Shimia litoralis]|uniref:Pilus assembly protein PilP n=1 Tax=Shimia litoralis TaxID=420403 RepID=A0A4U7N1B5_9RHOB|nr:hypothetical protein [Shimia litoralis]TKZ19268.1 hypothetical protein FAP39_11760 [Shimia litoralis]